MRGKLFFVSVLLTAVFLTGCVPVINSPSDELRMYTWQSELENGNIVSLSFDEDNGYLNIKNTDFTLNIGGLCILSDDRITICDKESGLNYSFGYTLYGDRVGLNYNSSVLSLKRTDG